MPLPKGQNPNHPAAGSTIKVEPIRDQKAICRTKKIAASAPLFSNGEKMVAKAETLTE